MMEGLLPFLYRAILHLASGGETPLGNPFRNDESSSPDASHYVCLAAAGARPLRPLMLAARHATEILVRVSFSILFFLSLWFFLGWNKKGGSNVLSK
jgi:hypothetical protein